MYDLLCLASHTSTLNPLLLHHAHVSASLIWIHLTPELIDEVVSFSFIYSGVLIFTSCSIVITPLLHMTQQFFPFHRSPICPFCLCLSVLPSVVLSSSLSFSPTYVKSTKHKWPHKPPPPPPPLHCPDCSCVICWANTLKWSRYKSVFGKEKGRGLPRWTRKKYREWALKRKQRSVLTWPFK